MNNKPMNLFCKSDTRTRAENIRLSEEAGKTIENLLRQGKAKERAIRCPKCNTALATAFMDSPVFLKFKCKCGLIVPVSLATFCTRKVSDDMEFKI